MFSVILSDRSLGASWPVVWDTPAHYAAMEWARFHDLDPMRIPAGSVVVRDPDNFAIECEEFVKTGPEIGDIEITDEGEAVTVRRIERGEAPPLPFPREVTG